MPKRNMETTTTRTPPTYNNRMHNAPSNHIAYFARTNARTSHQLFGIKRPDRLLSMYIIGKTGTGKSTLLETLATQDIQHNEGITFLDPHGDIIERIAQAIPAHRKDEVIYFDVPSPNLPYGYNPLRRVAFQYHPLATSGLMEVFYKRWGEKAWGQRMERVLRNAIFALLEQQNATLPDLMRLLREKGFQETVARRISNKEVRDFWQSEFPKYSYRYRMDVAAPILSKVGAFLSDPKLYRILTTPNNPVQFRKIMDEGKILLVNLATGRIGSDSAGLLGALFVTTIGLAAYSRANVGEKARKPHFLYMDEFQSFTTLSVANMLSEVRKYKLGMCLAHQYLNQLDPEVRHAVLGNAGTLISFRLGAEDALYIAQELAPIFGAGDLIKLPNHSIYLKLMIDGAPSKPFSANTLPPRTAHTYSKQAGCCL